MQLPLCVCVISMALILSSSTAANAASNQQADPGSGTGGVSVTGSINCVPEKFAVKSEKVIAKSISASTADATPDVFFQRTSAIDHLFWERGSTGSSVIHVTAEGPVLNSIASTHVTTDVNCTNAVLVTADIWQSDNNSDDDIENWKVQGYAGSFGKDALWRPAFDFDLTTHDPSVPVRIRWILHDKNGATPTSIKIQNFREQSFPMLVDKDITGGEARSDLSAPHTTDSGNVSNFSVTAVNGVPVLPDPQSTTQSATTYNDPIDSEGLMLIVRSGNKTAQDVEAAIEKGANVNKQDNNGESALMFSVMYGWGKPDILETLISHGALVNTQANNGMTALMLAAGSGNGGAGIDAVNILLQHGADPNIRRAGGWTALMDAALGAKDGVKVINALLQNGADPNIENEQGKTALMIAMSPDLKINPDIVQALRTATRKP